MDHSFDFTQSAGKKRFVKGCWSCRSKKVKCDKYYPVCDRCCRKNLSCQWSLDEPSLREKRRGAGSFKSRGSKWVPIPILPATSSSEQGKIEEHVGEVDKKSTLPPETNLVVESSPIPNDSWVTLSCDTEPSWSMPADDFLNTQYLLFPDDIYAGLFPVVDHTSQANLAIPTAWSSEMPFSLTHSLSYDHMTLPNSLILTHREHSALAHYQAVFSRYRATKDPQWSTHKILLDIGSQNSMVMHLILAVSINDTVSRERSEAATDEAQRHFEAGAQLLLEAMRNVGEGNTVALMATFFFLYLYMLNRKNVAPQRLRQLSMTVLGFVKKYKLDVLCGISPSQTQIFTVLDRNLLARLIIWTYTEDLKCGFRGFGGYLADYLAENAVMADQIYDESRTVLEKHWGSDYPDAQVVDDIENSIVLEFLYAMSRLHQLINNLSQTAELARLCTKNHIDVLFDTFERKYSSVFRLSTTNIRPRSRLLVNADLDVILFNALRIYYFRSTIVDLNVETPPEIHAAVKTVLSVTQKSFVARRDEYHDRLQWPLFMAGIETDDGIYREWIVSSLISSHMLVALQRTVEMQITLGQRLEMSAIRQMFCAEENSTT
ncbi:hypothetical protein V495_00596 [Pseudogymnoascus sp. VKM F-4514 (FW-929)]|nr:hypothetical protein V495_00596 [Pseudogymnoascus sp. VKM F-4514 (FW-929)]KFY66020.1 hypothetical protein V497_01126 [Pseudogymnoascus sp. VKM F-4516 (FW-969)]